MPHDISMEELRAERDAARAALAEAHADREVFLASLSHELRTPLTAIMGYTDLLALVRPAPAQSREAQYLDSIRAAGSHLIDVLDSVLGVTRLRAGALELREAPVEIAGMIAAAVLLVTPMAALRHVNILTRVPSHLPAVIGDNQLLRQILVNLLTNAIKISPPYADILVVVSLRKSGQLRLVVRDHGPGMDARTIERVMRPFAQAVQGTGFGSSGAGLGLALVRSMVELHDGSFQLVSHIGHGTRAVVTLPAARVRRRLEPGQQAEFTFIRSGTQPV